MRILLALLLAATTTNLPAQSSQPPLPKHAKEQLRFVLILSRHGVRAPLTSVEALNAYSSQTWPTWEVPLGNLTPHGAEAVRQMGAYLRATFDRTGLFTAAACPTPADLYLYSDTDERNLSSTRATYAGLAPGCPPVPVYTWQPVAGHRDPVFVPIGGEAFPPPPPDAALAAYRAALSGAEPAQAFSAAANPQLNTLARILAPDPAHPAATPVLNIPAAISANPTGDPVVSARGPLPSASGLAFNFLLEYADNKPLHEVAWGRLGSTPAEVEASLNRLIDLAVKPFALSHRTQLFAQAEGSNLLAHILDTLQQAAGTPAAPAAAVVPVAAARLDTAVNPHPSPTAEALASSAHEDVKAEAGQPASTDHLRIKPRREDRLDGAFGPAGTKVVLINAHDSNLFSVAGLLGLHWTADGRTDDTPPDSALVFELWQATYKHHPNPADDTPGRWFVRIRYRAQTLTQLRAASALTAGQPPAEVDLQPTGCRRLRCDLPIFLHAARATIDPAYTQLDVPPTQPAVP